VLVSNPASGVREASPLKNCSTYLVGILGCFSRQGHTRISKLSLLESVTGNLNSLISQNFSLFYLGTGGRRNGLKHSELCSMPLPPCADESLKSPNSLLNSLLAGNLGAESGSPQSQSPASLSSKIFRILQTSQTKAFIGTAESLYSLQNAYLCPVGCHFFLANLAKSGRETRTLPLGKRKPLQHYWRTGITGRRCTMTKLIAWLLPRFSVSAVQVATGTIQRWQR